MKQLAILAWEHGGGRGHVIALRRIAQVMQDVYDYEASLHRMDHAAELAPLCRDVARGAGLVYDRSDRIAAGEVPTATWGEFLGDLGFRDAEYLQARLLWWYMYLSAREPAVVIADYAPLAATAAGILGIPVVIAGTGYSVPPRGVTRFKVYLKEHDRLIYDEDQMLSCLNEAGEAFGMTPLPHLPAIYQGGLQLVRTIPLLDPYDGLRQDPLVPGYADVPRVADLWGGGDEVFVYFSTTVAEEPGVIEALCTLGVPVRAYVPGVDPEVAARIAAAGVIVEPRALPLSEIAARSRMMFNSGQHGILCEGLAAGLPQVCVPQHREHDYLARRAAEVGATTVIGFGNRSAEAIRSAILECYHDPRAQRLAQDHARTMPQFTGQDLRDAIRAVFARL